MHTATYSPDDNKLRLYPLRKLDAENLIPIASTAPKESVSHDGVTFWREYAAAEDARRGGWVILSRYLCRVGQGEPLAWDGNVLLFTDPESTWREYTYGSTPLEAIKDGMDDMMLKAKSLHPEHAEAVRQCTEERAKIAARHQAEDRAKKAAAALDDFKRQQTMAFNKRHGNKTGAAFERARQKTLGRTKQEYERLKAEAKEAMESLKTPCG